MCDEDCCSCETLEANRRDYLYIYIFVVIRVILIIRLKYISQILPCIPYVLYISYIIVQLFVFLLTNCWIRLCDNNSEKKKKKKKDYSLQNTFHHQDWRTSQCPQASTLSNEPPDNQFLDLDAWSREACKGRKKGRGAVYQPCSCTGWLQWSFAALATHSAITLQSPSSTVASKRGFSKIHLFPPCRRSPPSHPSQRPTLSQRIPNLLFLPALPKRNRRKRSCNIAVKHAALPRFCGFALVQRTLLSLLLEQTRHRWSIFLRNGRSFFFFFPLKGKFVSDSYPRRLGPIDREELSYATTETNLFPSFHLLSESIYIVCSRFLFSWKLLKNN